MPNYDFECSNCGESFEEYISYSVDLELLNTHADNAHWVFCPRCRSSKVQRKILIAKAIIYKGSGFYSYDNKQGNNNEK